GGAAANDFLMQFQADLLGVPVERPALVETTAMGAAQLAGLAVGFWRSPAELAKTRRKDRTFRPRMAAARRDGVYEGCRRAGAAGAGAARGLSVQGTALRLPVPPVKTAVSP